MHRQPNRKNRIRDNVQQTLTIVGKYIHDGILVGRFVIDPHLCRLPMQRGATRTIQPRSTAHKLDDMLPARTPAILSPMVRRRSSGGAPW